MPAAPHWVQRGPQQLLSYTREVHALARPQTAAALARVHAQFFIEDANIESTGSSLEVGRLRMVLNDYSDKSLPNAVIDPKAKFAVSERLRGPGSQVLENQMAPGKLWPNPIETIALRLGGPSPPETPTQISRGPALEP